MADRIEMKIDEPVTDPSKAPDGATGNHQQVRSATHPRKKRHRAPRQA